MRSRNWPRIKGLARDDSGAVAVLMGVLLTVLVAFVGLGVEVGLWWSEKSKAQSAADAAAYAAGAEMLRLDVSGSLSQNERNAIEYAGVQAAADNGYSSGVTITINGGAGEVTAEIERSLPPLLLGMLLTQDTVTVSARASVAMVGGGSGTCILALDESAVPGIKLTGNMTVTLNECGMHANATGSPGLMIHGNATVRSSDDISTSGYASLRGSIDVEDMDGNNKSVIEHAAIKSDPYANVDVADPGGCDEGSQVKVKNPGDLVPGNYYCGGVQFTGNGSVTLQPGTYYVGSELRFNGNFDVTGEGVSFVLMEGASVSMNGNAEINLSAPDSGNLEGILFYQDPDTAEDHGTPGESTFNGNMIGEFVGTLYFPKSHVKLNGNFSGSMMCSDFVAGTMMINGNMTLTLDNAACAAMGKGFGGTDKSIALVQ